MKLLITGGAGFIGSAVIRHIIQNTTHSAINVDKLTYAGNLESLADVSGDQCYAFAQVDICDRAALEAVFTEHQPDAIMHLAAESHVLTLYWKSLEPIGKAWVLSVKPHFASTT